MRNLIAAALALYAILGACLVGETSKALKARQRATLEAAGPSLVPCTTDQDCADKNPTLEGLYAFPDKAGR